MSGARSVRWCLCVVTKADIPRGKALGPQLLRSSLSQRRVPQRFVPPDALSAPEQAGGSAYGHRDLGRQLRGAGAARGRVTRGAGGRPIARLVEVPVAGTRCDGEICWGPGRGSTCWSPRGRRAGSPRTYLALQSVELIDFAPASKPTRAGRARRADAMATLRVTLRQAVLADGGRQLRARAAPRPAAPRATGARSARRPPSPRRSGPHERDRRARAGPAPPSCRRGDARRAAARRTPAAARQRSPSCFASRRGRSSRERGRTCGASLSSALGLGPLEALMDDPSVDEIMVNGPSTCSSSATAASRPPRSRSNPRTS